MKILGGHIGVLFYDVTTLYFEADYEDELRRTGFSKEGWHKNPQIILGLLVSPGGYPLAYCIHEDNKYEAHICICFVALKVCKELERLLKRHQRIAPLFSDDFWGTH